MKTLAVDPSVLATSNGHWGNEGRLGSTSRGKKWWLQDDGQRREKQRPSNSAVNRQKSGLGTLIICAGVVLLGLGR